MEKKRLEYYKKKLLTRRDELVKTITRTEEEGRQADDDPTVDLADKAAIRNQGIPVRANEQGPEYSEYDRRGLEAHPRRTSYGNCAICHEEMQQKRLEAVPWAKHCISCQEKMEQGLL